MPVSVHSPGESVTGDLASYACALQAALAGRPSSSLLAGLEGGLRGRQAADSLL
jgi:hypothetical protein